MNKLVILIICALFLTSCGGYMARSEFLQHDTMYKNWDHMKFSWFSHENPTTEDLEKSEEQQWWGFDVPYVPGQ